MIRYVYGVLICLAFAAGAYVWKIANTGHETVDKSAGRSAPLTYAGVIAWVGEQPITRDELDWEYRLHTEGILDKKNLTPIPDPGSKVHQYLSPLRDKLLSELIERKLVFSFIRQDRNFNIDDPARYETCLKEWQDVLEGAPERYRQARDQELLKTRICERSITLQYLEEKLFHDIPIPEPEITEFYENHQPRFNRKERVIIRQIVLASEKQARKIRNQVTRQNFAAMARKVSITPEAADGGRLGPFSRGEMPRFFNVAFSMRKGEIRGVLKSTYGFHLILLEK